MCTHTNPMTLRLMTYTRYGAMVGCLSCGTSWLIALRYETPASLAGRSGNQ